MAPRFGNVAQNFSRFGHRTGTVADPVLFGRSHLCECFACLRDKKERVISESAASGRMFCDYTFTDSLS